MDLSKIDRINELARKSKTIGLTEAEKAELAAIAGDDKEIESRIFSQLEFGTAGLLGSIDIQEPDGTIVNLGEKYGNKKSH